MRAAKHRQEGAGCLQGQQGGSTLTRAKAVCVCPLGSWVLSAELAEPHCLLLGLLAFGLHLMGPCP